MSILTNPSNLLNKNLNIQILLLVELAAYKYRLLVLGDLKWFLGIRVMRNSSERKLWLRQDSYIKKISAAYHPYTPIK